MAHASFAAGTGKQARCTVLPLRTRPLLHRNPAAPPAPPPACPPLPALPLQVYVWGRRHQYVNLSFLGIFTFTAPYLPWVLLAFSGLFGRAGGGGGFRAGGVGWAAPRRRAHLVVLCCAGRSVAVAAWRRLLPACPRCRQPTGLGRTHLTLDRASRLPALSLACAVMLGSSPLVDLLGMVAGHAYYFLEGGWVGGRGQGLVKLQ